MGINMQDEEEVRQYLENLEIEYTFSCYKENNGEGCCLLGEFMQSVRENYVKANAAFKKSCDKHNFPKACFKYGGDLFRGRGVQKDFDKALVYQKKACDLGWKEGCLVAGFQLQEESPHKDVVAAVDYFKRACDMDADDGCARVSSAYYTGYGPVAKDIKKCLEYGIRACDLGHMQSCANVSFIYNRGEGVERNEKKAAYFKNKALDLRQQAIRNRGFEMEQGIGSE